MGLLMESHGNALSQKPCLKACELQTPSKSFSFYSGIICHDCCCFSNLQAWYPKRSVGHIASFYMAISNPIYLQKFLGVRFSKDLIKKTFSFFLPTSNVVKPFLEKCGCLILQLCYKYLVIMLEKLEMRI